MTKKLTHKQLVNISSKWLKKHEQNIVLPNCSIIASEVVSSAETGEIPDILGWCSWASVLIEVKTTRKDFLRDRNKPFRYSSGIGVGEFRYYLSPDGILSTKDVPENWGLLHCDKNGKIYIIKIADKQQSNLRSERSILLSMLRRK